MPDHDAPPSADADRLVDDMARFLRGGPLPDSTADPPAVPRDPTRTWDEAAATADPEEWTPSPAAQDTARDRVVGPYRVVRWVARGGMGDVFHARHRDLPLEVALKTIRAAHALDRGARERFRVEAAAAASLDHPNVVKLYGFDEHEGELYIAMEWLPRGDLSDRLDGGPLPPREGATLVRALAAAMAYAHGRGVLHRDLKPRNVLLAADGTPKVADFGLARLRVGDQSAGLTHTGAVMGTPAYMAPEQAAGRAASARTDVYALGAILFELLTGAPPFTGGSKEAVLAQVRESDPPRPSSLTPGVPRDLEVICLRCLSKDAADRYESAAALVADLDRFLAGEPIAPGPWLRLRRAARAVRKRWQLIAQVAVGAAFAGTLAAFLPRGPEPKAEPPEPPDPRAALAAELAAGREVVLLGPNGPPPFGTRNRYNAHLTTSGVSPEGVFAVTSGEIGWVELVPAPAPARYRLSAEVRHKRSESGGKIGLYVAERTSPGPEGVENGWIVSLAYDDWETIEEHNEKNGLPPPPPPPGAQRWPNYAILAVQTRGRMPNGHPFEDFASVGRGIPFFPQQGAAPWTKIEFDVSPGRVRARWRDQPAGELTAAKVRETIAGWKASGPGRAGAGPTWELLNPTLAPTGGAGLYVHHGTAEYRNVVLTPLPPDTP